jgi:protein involved in polysaccharide export with SLBB domain
MSDGYDGREIAASYATNVGGSIPTGTTVFIDFYNKFYDLTNSVVGAGNGHSTNWQNTWRYIVPVSGYYSIKAVITLLFPPNTNAEAFAEIWVNGQMKIRGARSRYVVPATDTEPRGMVVVGDLYVKAGDAISISIFHNSGANRSLEGGFEVNSVHIHRISSPQTIAMGEVVAGFATHSNGQVIPSGTGTTLTGWNVVSDTHAIFNPSTGVLTVNRSGFLDLSFTFSFTSNATGSRALLITVNDTVELGLVEVQASSIFATGLKTGLSAYPVKAGDTIKFKVYQSSGGNLTPQVETRRNNVSWRIY